MMAVCDCEVAPLRAGGLLPLPVAGGLPLGGSRMSHEAG